MNDKNFILDCINQYRKSIIENDVSNKLIELKNSLLEVKKTNNKVIIAGNGGSAAIASHVSVDFTKQGGIRTINFNEYDLITCFSNDYGYENWLSRAVDFYADTGDHLILISSSGRSNNILNAAKNGKKKNLHLTTLTGFAENTELSNLSDISLWVDSKAYNIIENTHQIWLLIVCDMLVGKTVYSAK